VWGRRTHPVKKTARAALKGGARIPMAGRQRTHANQAFPSVPQKHPNPRPERKVQTVAKLQTGKPRLEANSNERITNTT
jgi:hypothetical protein